MAKEKIILLSSDPMFKAFISFELKKAGYSDTVVTCFDILSIPSFIGKTVLNILIMDLTSVSATESYIRSLIQRHNLKVFSVGSCASVNHLRAGISAWFNKPGVGIPERTIFMRELFSQIEAHASKSAEGQSAFRDTVGTNEKIIVMASSTGGTEALIEVLKVLPPSMPPILIVQHMPSMFTKQFASRADKLCKIGVKEAADGEYIKKGQAYIAPGDLHMRLIKKNSRLAVECFTAEKMHGVRPAADKLFFSVTPILGGNAVGVILTGMGSDGARGLYDLHAKGAKVIGQDKDSCVVYGMPKAAYDLGAVDYQLPLSKIGSKLVELTR